MGGDNLYAYVHNTNLLIDVLGLAGFLSPLNNVSGVYIFKDNNAMTAYVGSGLDINVRTANSDHKVAQSYLEKYNAGNPNITIEYVEVDLGTVPFKENGKKSPVQDHILRHFEQIQMDRVKQEGYDISQNIIRAEAEKKKKRNEDEIIQHNASAGCLKKI